MLDAVNEKVLLALEPRVVMAAMHTTTIRASITAYSTAVGPSSRFRNETRLLVKPRIRNSCSGTSPGSRPGNIQLVVRRAAVGGRRGGFFERRVSPRAR